MKYTKQVRIAFIIIVSMLILSCAAGPSSDTNKLLHRDPSIISGRLDNGLTYFLMKNSNLKGRLIIRLVVNAGSVDETDTESGVAHFVEHMAFNGTKSFAHNDLIKYFESIGMRYGDQLNAYTTYDSTVYWIDVPASDLKTVATAFKIVREYADGIEFDSEEVIRERGVILEEKRTRDTAEARILLKQAETFFGNSNYSCEIIGTAESIESMDSTRLRAFYNRQYLPQRMSVIVVGDMSTTITEKLVRAEMGCLQKKSESSPLYRDTGNRSGLKAAVAFDKELATSTITIAIPFKDPPFITVKDAQRQLSQHISIALINNRILEAIRRSEDGVVTDAAINLLNLRGEDSILNFSVSFTGTNWESAILFIKKEFSRIEQYGFSPNEVLLMQKTYIAWSDNAVKNGFNAPTWADFLTNQFLHKNILFTNNNCVNIFKDTVSLYNPADAIGIAHRILSIETGAIFLAMSDSTREKTSPATLSAAYIEPVGEISPWVESPVVTTLMEKLPESIKPLSITEDKEIGLIDMTYANGFRVLLKKTNYQGDKIVFSFASPNGTETLSDIECANINMASQLIPMSGFKEILPESFINLMTGKNISFSLFVTDTRIGFNGSTNQQNMETAFQLARRTMTDPVVDPSNYSQLLKKINEGVNSFIYSPQRVLQAEVNKSLFPQRPRAIGITKKEDLAMLNRLSVIDTFKSLFCPPKDGVLVISGSFDTEKTQGLCDRYFGSLPGTVTQPTPTKAFNVILSAGATNVQVKVGTENKATAVFVFKTPISDTDSITSNGLILLASALDRSLRERIREAKGGTYKVSVTATTEKVFKFSAILISFDTDPSRITELMPIVEEEVAKLRESGIPQKTLAELILIARKGLEDSSQSNNFWVQSISEAAIRGESLDIAGTYETVAKAIDTEWTKKAAARYLDPANLAVFTLLPADKP